MSWLSNLWSGIKSVASKVYDTVRSPIAFISQIGDKVKNIPFVGGALSTVLSPLTGAANTAKGFLDTAKDVASVGSAIGLQRGGMVPMKKVYQA